MTEKGLQKTEQLNQEDLNSYQDMGHRELVEKVQHLEAEINRLEHQFEVYQNQIKQKL
jgi:hypothetical protein